jgi:pimeloyl-ACP methyl ester carboxylesterase
MATVKANGVAFEYLEDGPADGPLALCLHGFPDSARTWRYLLPELASAGFHAVAPWMRGYAPTEVPADGRYQTGALVADATALHEALGGDSRAVLIGHDWGAVATYGAASFAPDKWSRIVAMAVPPSVGASLFASYAQVKRSFYMFVFQSPLAEFLVSANNLAFIDGLWADWSPGYDGAQDAAWVKEALSEQANLSAALGYYRSTFGTTPPAAELAAEQEATGKLPAQPVMYLHGRQDGCIGVELVPPALPDNVETVIVDGAGHFLHVEKPDEVNQRVVKFLTA